MKFHFVCVYYSFWRPQVRKAPQYVQLKVSKRNTSKQIKFIQTSKFSCS